ncbi:hypothetical protein WJX81_006879 [Elliptochloris bilobata]|uniref:Small ribosomal subunit protein bS18c n=1 Tax=Elliptochloris bilobata TaxID=381761 RepID=A0AAW1QML1_9CHLO
MGHSRWTLTASFASSSDPPDASPPPAVPPPSDSEEEADVLDEVAERQRWRQFAERALDSSAGGPESDGADADTAGQAGAGAVAEDSGSFEGADSEYGGQEYSQGAAADSSDFKLDRDDAEDRIGSQQFFADALRDDGPNSPADEEILANTTDEDAAEGSVAGVVSGSASGSGAGTAGGQIDWTSWLKQRMSTVRAEDPVGGSRGSPFMPGPDAAGSADGGRGQGDFLSRYGSGASGAAAGDMGVAGQPQQAGPDGGAAVVRRADAVGMQPLEGWDQTYGELGQGMYAGDEINTSTRIHPTRTFLPGQTYTPEDLVKPEQASKGGFVPEAPTEKIKNGQVRREVDFRHVEILHVFLSATGRLPARRKSKLKQSTHRFMCRQIKVARQLALIPVTARLVDYEAEHDDFEDNMEAIQDGM